MSWNDYDDRQEARDRVRREIARRARGGESLVPLESPQGNKKLTSKFWARAWCDHLESHADYEHRLPRGRSYLRQGNVYNLEIAPGLVSATVTGSEIYDVRIAIDPLKPEAWARMKSECAGKVETLLDLLAGKLGENVLRTISDPETGLFPKPKEIHLSCTCPDWADMCKHVAAVLYGVGVRLDSAPELFFVLRSLDPAELLAHSPLDSLAPATAADAALAEEDLSALFGIDLTDDPAK